MADRAEARHGKPTRTFAIYAAQLAVRIVLLGIAGYLLAVDPGALAASSEFGPSGGFGFVDLAYIALALDFLTKFLARAPISAGSLKQYRMYQIPTELTVEGGGEALRARVDEVAELGHRLAAQGVAAVEEIREGLAVQGGSALAFARRLLNSVDFLKLFSFDERDLAVDRSMRAVLYRRRRREIVPVILFWVVGNTLAAVAFARLGLLSERTALAWSLFYFVFDMVCVVLWCPLQLLLMRNRCCTTCQIFNWDAIMVATPLLFVGGWYGGLLLAMALAILLRWEIAALRHPERFDELTNARLTCAQCKDKLCYLRKPLNTAAAGRDEAVG